MLTKTETPLILVKLKKHFFLFCFETMLHINRLKMWSHRYERIFFPTSFPSVFSFD